MNQSDKVAFKQMLAKAHGVLRVRNGFAMTNDILATYFEALEDLDIETVANAVKQAIQSENFFPTPARLREIAGKPKTSDRTREMAVVYAVRKVTTALATAKGSSVAFDDMGIHYAVGAIDSFNGWKIGRALYDKAFGGNSYDTHALNEWREKFEVAYNVYLDIALQHGEVFLRGAYPSFLVGEDNDHPMLIGAREAVLHVMQGGFDPNPRNYSYSKIHADGVVRTTSIARELEIKSKQSEMYDEVGAYAREEVNQYYFDVLSKKIKIAEGMNDIWWRYSRNKGFDGWHLVKAVQNNDKSIFYYEDWTDLEKALEIKFIDDLANRVLAGAKEIIAKYHFSPAVEQDRLIDLKTYCLIGNDHA